jgi:hypothetical protein
LASLLSIDNEAGKRELKSIRTLNRSSRGLGVSAFSDLYGTRTQLAYNECTKQLRQFFAGEAGRILVGGSKGEGSQSRNLLLGLRLCRDVVRVAPGMPQAMRDECMGEDDDIIPDL